jgi:Transposase DDE domain
MYFKFSLRKHPQTGKLSGYYRLVESYRNADSRVCHRTILNVGFMEGVSPEQLNKIQRQLTERYERRQALFEQGQDDPIVKEYVEELWQRIAASNKLDLGPAEKLSRMVDMDTLQHSNAREIGAENIAYQTWEKLQLAPLLLSHGFSEEQAMLAATQVVGRAVHPASELRTARWIKENSAVCELTGYDIDKITKDKLYESSLHLYQVKDALEKHLSNRTNELFDLVDKIILYDLTNTYFEGEKRNSRLAKFGRSKEKRGDAKLVVLALVVNTEGFIKYSSILEGNVADCNTLSAMIEKLASHAHGPAVVVLDAGIATEENLKLIEGKGYKYLCVSRAKLKDYACVPNRLTTLLDTKSGQTIRLRSVTTEKNTDYYLEVKSPSKEKKEEAMKLQFEKRFEGELQKIHTALHGKGGVKKFDKVHQRIGRAKEKYPSVQHYYTITVSSDAETGLATEITWKKDEAKHQEKNEGLGIYFLRTNLNVEEEFVVWNIYNTIREIENAFRTLKTDLDLRPIYHKNDDATMAHLHLGILAYWLVNTVRHQLKQNGINSCWREIVRIGNTQKVVTTSGTNTYDKTITIRKCTKPTENLKDIYNILQTKHQPFTKRKSVVHKLKPKKTEPPQTQLLLTG